jgi:type IV secretion system protein VirB9
MIIDRLFSHAELRLASGRRVARVSIEREDRRRKGRS